MDQVHHHFVFVQIGLALPNIGKAQGLRISLETSLQEGQHVGRVHPVRGGRIVGRDFAIVLGPEKDKMLTLPASAEIPFGIALQITVRAVLLGNIDALVVQHLIRGKHHRGGFLRNLDDSFGTAGSNGYAAVAGLGIRIGRYLDMQGDGFARLPGSRRRRNPFLGALGLPVQGRSHFQDGLGIGLVFHLHLRQGKADVGRRKHRFGIRGLFAPKNEGCSNHNCR